MRVVGHRPRTSVLNDWRGGQIWGTNPATTTIRLRLEANMVGTRTVPTSIIPHRVIVGDAVVCRVSGSGADSYEIIEVRGSVHVDACPSDQAASVARGEFRPGAVTPAEGANWDPYFL